MTKTRAARSPAANPAATTPRVRKQAAPNPEQQKLRQMLADLRRENEELRVSSHALLARALRLPT